MESERLYNPNYLFLIDSHEYEKRGVILEGSSRSGKTWSGIDFIIWLCLNQKGMVLNIIRETFNSFKTTLYDDFNRRFIDYGLKPPCADARDIASIKLNENKINFLGADKLSKFHGASCDYFFVNEILDISQPIFDQLEQRCRKFWWADYNPKYTDHWLFRSVEPRPDIAFLRTTFLDNPFISEPERNKILSYEPTAENIKNGTADDYNWKVYGLGLRTAIKGLVFPYVTWIKSFPESVKYNYGMDFGFTCDPTCITKIGISGNDLFIEVLLYEPIDNATTLSDFMDKSGVRRDIVITADTADKWNDCEMVRDLRNLDWLVQKVNKGRGILHSIGRIKEYKINIVYNVNAKREQENYKWREVNGISLNEPVDKYNHMWDAVRYAIIGREKSPMIIW